MTPGLTCGCAPPGVTLQSINILVMVVLPKFLTVADIKLLPGQKIAGNTMAVTPASVITAAVNSSAPISGVAASRVSLS